VRPVRRADNPTAICEPIVYTILGGTRRTGLGYAKIILVMAENTKKLVKIQTQKQIYEVLVYKGRLMWKLSLDPPTTNHNCFNAVFIYFDLVLG
jgi:hypothetical protein